MSLRSIFIKSQYEIFKMMLLFKLKFLFMNGSIEASRNRRILTLFNYKGQTYVAYKIFVCKMHLLARALGLKAKCTRDDRVSCIQTKYECSSVGLTIIFLLFAQIRWYKVMYLLLHNRSQ